MIPSRAARAVALAAHAALLVALPLLGGRLGALAALPLLAPVRGLWRGSTYAYGAGSLLLTLYVGAFLMEAFAQPGRATLSLALAAVAAVEFCALVLFVRLRAAERRVS